MAFILHVSPVAAGEYCYSRIPAGSGLAYRKHNQKKSPLPQNLQMISMISDVYETNATTLGEFKGTYYIEMEPNISIKVTIGSIEHQCKLQSSGSASCGKLQLLPSKGSRSSREYPYGWTLSDIYSFAEYQGNEYFVINSVTPISYARVSHPNSETPRGFEQVQAIVGNPILGMSCINKYDKFDRSIAVTQGYGRTNTGLSGYFCVQSSICTMDSTKTIITESAILVPKARQNGFMKHGWKGLDSGNPDSFYLAKTNVENFLRLPEMIPVTIQYTVEIPLVKPDLGF